MGFLSNLFKKPRTDAVYEIKSPNGRVVASFEISKGRISYFVRKDEKQIIRRSRLGLELKDAESFGENLSVVRAYTRKVEGSWEALWGEQRVIRNDYTEMNFYLEETVSNGRLLTIRFKVYDNGVAFRYEVPAQPDMSRMVIEDELTQFVVDSNSKSWSIPAYQPDRYEYNYREMPVRDLRESVHTPLTIQTTSGYYIAIHEAALYNYGGMTVKMTDYGLKTDITPLSDGMRAYVDLPFSTPWRLIMIEDDALDLTTNHVMLNLNDDPKGDFSWVEPCKFFGIWWAMFVGEWTWAPGERHGATTEHAKQYIDYCKEFNIPALLIEGWNDGWEGDWLQNGINNKFMESTPDFDIKEITAYAKSKGVELIGHHETVGFVDNYEKQMEDAYRYLVNNGVRYIKSGYAGSMMMINGKREYHHSQVGVLHYQRALELAAKYHIMLDVHEPIKSTGIERTWPNLMTREGARGQEYEGGALSPSHACYIPYTRLLAGGMDYTPGIFDVYNHMKRMATTITRQIAYYVTIYSSMQMAADRPFMYQEKRDLFEFVQHVPTRFETTIPLMGEIGKSYVVARCAWKSDDWYIGGVTNEEGRNVELYLDFLEDGVNYSARIYRDSEDAHYRDNQLGYVIEDKVLRRGDRLDIYMAPGGGFAIEIKKK